MRKIISLFQRNYETDRLVRDKVTPGAEWVLNGEGIATRKFDGSCCAILEGIFLKRFTWKPKMPIPIGFRPAQDPDPITGQIPGWVPVSARLEDKWFREAITNSIQNPLLPLREGTYEAIGPHFQGNAEDCAIDILIPHGSELLDGCPRDFDGIRNYLSCRDIEGIVWWHPDGRMVKIKKNDFGLKRVKIKKTEGGMLKCHSTDQFT